MKYFLIIAFTAITACSSLVKEKEINALNDYQNFLYKTKQEITASNKTLAKGNKIKIIIKVSSDWVKVYGYNANTDILKSERILILYLFKEDFPKGQFSKKYFNTQLNKLLKPLKKIKLTK